MQLPDCTFAESRGPETSNYIPDGLTQLLPIKLADNSINLMITITTIITQFQHQQTLRNIKRNVNVEPDRHFAIGA